MDREVGYYGVAVIIVISVPLLVAAVMHSVM